MSEPQLTPLSLDEIFDLLGPDQAEALMFAQLGREDQKDVVFAQVMHAFKTAGADEPPPEPLLTHALARPGLEPLDKGETINGQWYQVIEYILAITEPTQATAETQSTPLSVNEILAELHLAGRPSAQIEHGLSDPVLERARLLECILAESDRGVTLTPRLLAEIDLYVASKTAPTVTARSSEPLSPPTRDTGVTEE